MLIKGYINHIDKLLRTVQKCSLNCQHFLCKIHQAVVVKVNQKVTPDIFKVTPEVTSSLDLHNRPLITYLHIECFSVLGSGMWLQW